jgi:hypothetical protein
LAGITVRYWDTAAALDKSIKKQLRDGLTRTEYDRCCWYIQDAQQPTKCAPSPLALAWAAQPPQPYLEHLAHLLLVPDSSQVATAHAWAVQMQSYSNPSSHQPQQLSLEADSTSAVVVADVTTLARWLQRVTGDMASSSKPAQDGPLWHLQQVLLWQPPQCAPLDWPPVTANVLRLVDQLAAQHLLQQRPTILLGAQVRAAERSQGCCTTILTVVRGLWLPLLPVARGCVWSAYLCACMLSALNAHSTDMRCCAASNSLQATMHLCLSKQALGRPWYDATTTTTTKSACPAPYVLWPLHRLLMRLHVMHFLPYRSGCCGYCRPLTPTQRTSCGSSCWSPACWDACT